MSMALIADFDRRMHRLFGAHVTSEPLSSAQRMGRRFYGVDLQRPLMPEQAKLFIDLLDHYSVISFAGQDQATFRMRHLERIANHFGAPIPHPKNYANYKDFAKNKAPLRLLPVEKQARTRCDAAFPDDLQCLEDADSPAVYLVTNLPGSGPDQQENSVAGLHWHTDIEFEPVASVDEYVLRSSGSQHSQFSARNMGQ